MKVFPLSSWVTATVSLDGGEVGVVVVVTTSVVVGGEGYTTLAGGAYAVPLGATVPLDAEADRGGEGWVRVVVVELTPSVVALGSPGATSEGG